MDRTYIRVHGAFRIQLLKFRVMFLLLLWLFRTPRSRPLIVWVSGVDDVTETPQAMRELTFVAIEVDYFTFSMPSLPLTSSAPAPPLWWTVRVARRRPTMRCLAARRSRPALTS